MTQTIHTMWECNVLYPTREQGELLTITKVVGGTGGVPNVR